MSGLRLTLRSPLQERVDLGAAFAARGRPRRRPSIAAPRGVVRPRRRPCRSATCSRSTARPTAPPACRRSLLAERVGADSRRASCAWMATSATAPARAERGRLERGGNAGHSTGEGMSGGILVVRGNAGNRAGAAAPGRKRGMTGGELVIMGNAGDETGALHAPRTGGGRRHDGTVHAPLHDRRHGRGLSAPPARTRRSGTSADRSSASARWSQAPPTATPASSSRSTCACCSGACATCTGCRSRRRTSTAGSAATAATSRKPARERFSHGVQHEATRHG